MDPVEKAIRNALAKGNANDRAFREKVYRSAFAALERASQSQPQLTVEMAIKRKQNLQARITGIEAEFLPKTTPTLPVQPAAVPEIALETEQAASRVAPAPTVEAPAVAGRRPARDAPSITLDDRAESDMGAPDIDLGPPPRSGEAFGADVPPDAIVAPDRDRLRSGRRRRPFAAMFLVVTALCIVAIGGWWAYQTGLLLPSSDGQSPTPPQLVEEDEFDPAEEQPVQPGEMGGTQELRNWTVVFSPDDMSSLNAPSGASAEAGQDESGSFVRIRSGEDGAAVVFDVSQQVLEMIAGRKAVFNLSARAEEGTQTQISISCDFGEMGDCGRKRYAVGYERGEYLFDVSLPANQPGAGGSIAINSDFSNEGKALDVYEIRVSVVE